MPNIITFYKKPLNILSSRDNEILKMIEEFSNRAIYEMSKFYDLDQLTAINLYVGGRSMMDDIAKRPTESWCEGLSSSNGIYLIDPRLFKNTAVENNIAAETNHIYSEEHYFKLIKHEIGHKYFRKIINIPYKYDVLISWLDEGCQMYAAEQESNNTIDLTRFNSDIYDDRSVKGFHTNALVALTRFIEIYTKDVFIKNLKQLGLAMTEKYNENKNKNTDDIRKILQEAYELQFYKLFGFTINKTNFEYFVKTGSLPNV